jgi:hypothetical protein
VSARGICSTAASSARARQYFEKALAPPAQLTGFGAVASYFELERMKR